MEVGTESFFLLGVMLDPCCDNILSQKDQLLNFSKSNQTCTINTLRVNSKEVQYHHNVSQRLRGTFSSSYVPKKNSDQIFIHSQGTYEHDDCMFLSMFIMSHDCDDDFRNLQTADQKFTTARE